MNRVGDNLRSLSGAILSVACFLATSLFGGAVAHDAGPASAGSANIAQTDIVETGNATTRLIAEKTAIAPGETTWFALGQQLREGWHVYWKNPGDSGLPLELNWRLPEGYSAGSVIYPTPERIPVGPLANFGHHGAPVFLVPISAPAGATGSVAIGVDATWLICEEVCIPESASLQLTLPVGGGAAIDSRHADLFAAGRAAAPAPFAGKAVLTAYDDGLILSARPEAGVSEAIEAIFFPEEEGLIEPAAPQPMRATADGFELRLTPGFAYDAEASGPSAGVIVVKDGAGLRRGFEIIATRERAASGALAPSLTAMAADDAFISGPTGAGAAGPARLAWLFAAAFLGGALLNLMPCVFPILFIKAASFVKSSASDRSTIVRHGVVYTAGVVATFLLLGGALLVLRAGGEQVGWGFHLQSPIVVLISAYVLFLVGLNLAGVFTVGESLQNVGAKEAQREGDAGAFFTGALAVAVAAPCIGPLLSAPMGAAIMLPPAAGLAIFLAMGLGLAAPYLALSLSPQLARALPRPGAWMKTFKQALSFPVFAAAAYFLWVLAAQSGSDGLGRAFAGLVLLGSAAWLFELAKTSARSRRIVQGLAFAALLAAVAPMVGLRLAPAAEAAETGAYGAIAAVPFDPDEIARQRAAGVGVFVDFTAAWCVTCQVTKLTVLSRPSVAKAFERHGAMLMAADWTRRDPEITAALESFGANGVPLYVYFPPDSPPVVLDLPLTERALINALGS